MSPSEWQLRAALREGEGDSPDASALISHAVRVRRDRRRRTMSVATGAAVVAIVAGGVSAIVSLGSGNGESAGANHSDRLAGGAGFGTVGAATGGARSAVKAPMGSALTSGGATVGSQAAGSQAAGSRAVQNSATQVQAATALNCPTAASRYMLPGGGGIGEFGSNDRLFARTVAAMKVCAYPAGAGLPRQKVLAGSAAAKVVAQLESATSEQPKSSCPSSPIRSRVELLAVDSAGTALKPVVIDVGCPDQATNGTAVRYLHALPAAIEALVG